MLVCRTRNISRSSRFTRFRTTALPIRLLTVTPSRERAPAAGRRRRTRCDVWHRRASRCNSRYSTRRRIRAALGKRSDPTTRSTGLLRRNADRQALAALVAATLQNLASARSGHAGPEPVRALPAAVAGLIRPLHLEWVRSGAYEHTRESKSILPAAFDAKPRPRFVYAVAAGAASRGRLPG